MRSKYLSYVYRIFLAAIFILVCLQFSWMYFREINTNVLLNLMNVFDLEVTRTSTVTFKVDNNTFLMGVSCTSIDAFMGSIPLLWKLKESWPRQIKFFILYFLVFITINQLRLLLGFIFYDFGVTWFWAHEIPSGIFLFGLAVWTFHQKRWKVPSAI